MRFILSLVKVTTCLPCHLIVIVFSLSVCIFCTVVGGWRSEDRGDGRRTDIASSKSMFTTGARFRTTKDTMNLVFSILEAEGDTSYSSIVMDDVNKASTVSTTIGEDDGIFFVPFFGRSKTELIYLFLGFLSLIEHLSPICSYLIKLYLY
mgnify:CR=1 FL=1